MKREIHNIGICEVDLASFECTDAKGNVHQLYKSEVTLLKMFIENNNQVISRSRIAKECWGYNDLYTPRTMDNIVCKFKKIFENNNTEPKYFYSVRGIGYKLKYTPCSP